MKVDLTTKAQRIAFRRKTKRALNVLKIRRLKDDLYLVSGGSMGHTIRVVQGIPFCDCYPFNRGQTVLCSHLICYYLYTGEYSEPEENS